MLVVILCVFRFIRLLGSGHQAIAVENLALRLQLAAIKRKRKRPVLTQWTGCSGSECQGFGPAGVAQQMVEAFADREAPRYLIRDRDGVYGTEVRRRLQSLRIEEVLTAPQSPWQNAYAERLIGSIRREYLNHFIILNARHLKKTLAAYLDYYHRSRPHLALEKQCPIERKIMKHGAIIEIAELGGLHHRYERVAA